MQYQHRQVTQPVVNLRSYVTHTASRVTHTHEDDTMARSRLPLVYENRLFLHGEEKDHLLPVIVESESWYTWLAHEQNQSFSFKNHLGTFTARRERKRHGWYWYIYHKRNGKLRKAYLGKTEQITFERLNVVATKLAGQSTNDNRSKIYSSFEVNNAS